MKNDKMIARRIVIFLALSFVPPWVMCFLYMARYGKTADGAYYSLICLLAMLAPALANILTRVITNEGFEGCRFSFRFKGNVRYFVIALCYPVLCGYLTAMISAAALVPNCSLYDVITKTDYMKAAAASLFCAGTSVISIIPGFGEEFGWRAYLTPKLEEKLPFPAAVVTSGIIWGLWHAPLIVCGHNFGTEYSGYPYVGIALMCLFCVFMGAFLTSLVKATGSVFPAALAHIAFNNTAGVVSGTILSFVVDEDFAPADPLLYPLIMLSVSSFVSLTASVIIIKHAKD